MPVAHPLWGWACGDRPDKPGGSIERNDLMDQPRMVFHGTAEEYRDIYTDEQGQRVVEVRDSDGTLIDRQVQPGDTPLLRGESLEETALR